MLKHIDCFAGVGGVATGFHAAGISTCLAIEKVDTCAETYSANHPNTPLIKGDIRDVRDAEIRQHVEGDVDVVTAGMPCETFSTAGSSSRSFYDHRQTLFEEAIRIADTVNSKFILFENVPGFANKKVAKDSSELVIDLLRKSLQEHGYNNKIEIVLNAKDYGVPQSRQRLFVLASRENVQLTAPHASNNRVTVGEAFANLPHVDTAGPIISDEFLPVTNDYLSLLANHKFWNMPNGSKCTYQKSPKHRPHTIKRFELIQTGEGLKSLFDRLPQHEVERLQSERILPKKWYIQRNRRLNPADVSPTVTSHCIDELLHPTLNRAITVREAARLQSFPDSYDFIGGPEICPHVYETQDKYEQIGDAVPPLMAYSWAVKLKELLNAGRGAPRANYSSMCGAL
ncbi:DNA cytosine methyltransferase [uncultured Roseovarius sp.]|uniref:DNA cytosine methyltransferase n=1 Tax=uncultured Roseovarius sp. TaxID=293344 RepID=UPI0025E97485|nr:DNA (cytosine-5-)-methyltransferase [uncultured Roseovarius sp.]